jgi:hypothetical protein
MSTTNKQDGLVKCDDGDSTALAPIVKDGTSLERMTDQQATDLKLRAEAIEQLMLLRDVSVPNSFSLKLYPDGTTATLHIDGVKRQVDPALVSVTGTATDEASTQRRLIAESEPDWCDLLAHDVMKPFLDQALDAYRAALADVIRGGLPR